MVMKCDDRWLDGDGNEGEDGDVRSYQSSSPSAGANEEGHRAGGSSVQLGLSGRGIVHCQRPSQRDWDGDGLDRKIVLALYEVLPSGLARLPIAKRTLPLDSSDNQSAGLACCRYWA